MTVKIVESPEDYNLVFEAWVRWMITYHYKNKPEPWIKEAVKPWTDWQQSVPPEDPEKRVFMLVLDDVGNVRFVVDFQVREGFLIRPHFCRPLLSDGAGGFLWENTDLQYDFEGFEAMINYAKERGAVKGEYWCRKIHQYYLFRKMFPNAKWTWEYRDRIYHDPMTGEKQFNPTLLARCRFDLNDFMRVKLP